MLNNQLSKSQELIARAEKVLPGGISRNTLLTNGPMLYAHRGSGCRVIDVDGVQRMDFANNVASLIHGHCYQPVVEAVADQLKLGTAFTMATEAEVRYAELLCSRSDSFDKLRFVNSGTEAVMTSIKAARACTGKRKLAKVEGAYHGAYDYVEVSQSPGPANWGDLSHPNPVPLAHGTPTSITDDMVILPFNDADKALALLDEHKHDIACVLVDPIPHRIGMIPVSPDFVRALRNWTTENNSLLIFDEVITFRTEIGGAQQRYDIRPDITTMGKMIGGGFPVGAIAGRNNVMDVFVNGREGLRLPLSGTFSANPITMTAGYVTMSHYDEDAVATLNSLSDYAREALGSVIDTVDVPACVTGAGSLLRIHFSPQAPKNYRDCHLTPARQSALGEFISALYANGVMMIHTASAALSTAMQKTDIDQMCEAVELSLQQVKPMLDQND